MDECTTLKALIMQAKQKKGNYFEKKNRFTKQDVDYSAKNGRESSQTKK